MDNQLQDFINNDNCYCIHYASDGFYSGSSPAPRISCIVIYNLKTNQCYKFSISEHLAASSRDVEAAESKLLDDFNCFIKKHSDVCFIHWNMRANGFGFKAMQARANELGIDFPMPDNDHLFDLSSYVEYLAGKKLSIKQILWFNYFSDDCFLDGKTEAEYFEQGKFYDILSSVHTKVIGLSCVITAIQENNLTTEKPFSAANDALTKKEIQEQTLIKIAQEREQMLKDIREHNRKILQKREQMLKDIDEHNRKILQKREELFLEEQEEQSSEFWFYSSEHPLLSFLSCLFANR